MKNSCFKNIILKMQGINRCIIKSLKKIMLYIRDILLSIICWLKQHKKIAVCYPLVAFSINVLCYLQDNLQFSIFEDLDVVTFYSKFNGSGNVHEQIDQKNEVLIDMSACMKSVYNRQTKEFEMITDRDTLCHLLNQLYKAKPKFVFLDILFNSDERDSIINDSILNIIELMYRNKKICICRSEDIDSLFYPFSIENKYIPSFISNSCTRVPFITNGENHAALYIYNVTHSSAPIIPPNEYFHFGKVFSIRMDLWNGFLFRNCPLFYIPKDITKNTNQKRKYNTADNLEYYQYNYSLLSDSISIDNKIVFVGHFNDFDQHITYAGMKPGIVLTYLQYKALEDNTYLVDMGLWWGLFCLYYIVLIMRFHYERVISYARRLLNRFDLRISFLYDSLFDSKIGRTAMTVVMAYVFLSFLWYLRSVLLIRNVFQELVSLIVIVIFTIIIFNIIILRFIKKKKFKCTIRFAALLQVLITSFIGYTLLFGIVSYWGLTHNPRFIFSTIIPSLVFTMVEWIHSSSKRSKTLYQNIYNNETEN